MLEPPIPSPLTSMPLAAGSISIPSTPGGLSGLPRKPKPGSGTLDIKEGSPRNLDHEPGSASGSGVSPHYGPFGPASLPGVQEAHGVQILKQQSGLSLNTGHARTVSNSQGTIYHSFKPDTCRETITSEAERTDHSVTYVAPATARHRSHQPQKEVATLQATVGQEQYDVRSPFIGRVQRVPSAGLSPLVFSAPDAFGTPLLWNSTSGSVAEQLLHIEYLHQEERNRILALMLAEQESCKVSHEGQLESLRTEIERLRSELSGASTRVDELRQHHGAQSTALDAARSQLENKTEQISNARREYEKLQGDLSAHSAQITDLEERYDTQSQHILSTRHELQAKALLLEEKEHVIISLSDKVTQAERENSTMADQVATAQGAVDQLRVELSSASSRTADVQKRYEAQSREFDTARDELHQLKGLYQGNSSGRGVADQIRSALKEKNQQIEVLRKDLAASTSRNDELQKLYETLSREVSGLGDELTAKTSQYEGTITSLNAQVERWKSVDGANKEQIATSLTRVKELQDRLSSSTSQLAQLQGRYDVQSGEFANVRDELQSSILSCESKERTIVSLNTKVEQWEGVSAKKAEQLTIALKQVEELQRDLSTSIPRYTELRALYEGQTDKFNALRNDLQASVLSGESKDFTIVALTAELEEWKSAGVGEPKEVVTILQRAEKFQLDLSTSASELKKLQNLYEERSSELTAVREELDTSISSEESKDLTIAALNTEVHQWKDAGAGESKQVATILEKAEKLENDLATSTSKFDKLQNHYEKQSVELARASDELQASISSGKEKDLAISALKTEIEQWRGADVDEPKQVATLEQTKKLQDDLAISTSKFHELRNHYQNQSDALTVVHDELQASISSGKDKDLIIATLTAELGEWKSVGVDEPKKVVVILEQIERLQQEHFTSTSQLVQLRTLYEERSRELTVVQEKLQSSISSGKGTDLSIAAPIKEVQQRKDASASESKEVATTFERVEKHQQDLSTSASELEKLHNPYKKQSSKLAVVQPEHKLKAGTLSDKHSDLTIAALTTEVQRWKDAGGPEQLTIILKQVKKLENELSLSASQLDEFQTLYKKQSDELATMYGKLRTSISSSEGKDLTIAALIAEVERLKATTLAEDEQHQQGFSTPASQFAELPNLGEGHLGTTREQIENNLSTSASQLAESRVLYEKQSGELLAVRNELHTCVLSGESKDYNIASLTAEVQKLKDAGANESRQVATILRQVKRLQKDLATSASKLDELQNLYQKHSGELARVRDELQASISSVEDKDLTTSVLTTEIERSKGDGADELKQATTILERVDRLQNDLFTSASKLAEFRDLHERQLRDFTGVHEVLSSEESEDREPAVAREDLEQLRDDLVTSTSQIERLKESEVATADELIAAHRDLEQLRRDLTASSSQIIEFRQRYEAQSSQLEQWKNSDAAKTLQLTAADEKLELRRQELSTLSFQLDKVHRFFAIVEKHADTTIIQMVQKLNAEVQQNTTFIAERILDEFQPQAKTSSEEQDIAIQRVSAYIGQALTDSLRKKRDDLALYLPIAFQAYLTNYLSGVISAWTTEEGHSDLIDTIYQRLQREEAQTISGHWRSLTRTYTLPTCMSSPDTIATSTVAGLSDILVAAGCAASASAAKSTVSSKFLDKVSSIISIAGQLSKMIGEVVSSDFEVLAAGPDVVFEGTTMEKDVDDYDDIRDTAGGTATGEKVLCSTQLGLTKRMPLESGKVTLTAMRAKVLLASFLNV